MNKRVFIAATMQNDGKTTFSLGLIASLKKRFNKVGFIKPVGQRYLLEQGYMIDEDSVLINQICNLEFDLKDTSPIAVERGFTERYIQRPNPAQLKSKIRKSFNVVSKGSDIVVIEGTGHAGVGSVFDLSNASVAKMLKSKVVLITSGGLGRPIDEIMLNVALFEKAKVSFLGVVINKVRPEKFEKIDRLIRKGLARKGISVLGVLPYQRILSAPTVEQIKQETRSDILWGGQHLSNLVDNVIIAAMVPYDVLNYLKDRVLVITPGDREDVITTILSSHLVGGKKDYTIVGIILTGGIVPHKEIVRLIKKTDIPVLLSKEDTYRVAARVHDRTIKIRPEDKEKIEKAVSLVEYYVDIERIVKLL